ncbi:MAG: NAD(P)-binding protein [Chloroherpetonaceae bacterium]|nr:NAD(P)-binding protein [Chloroherpetonaceae bacterium]
MRKKVIIIGAGLGGLAAAIRLAHRGYAVQVFERNATVGGKMQELYSPDGCYRFNTCRDTAYNAAQSQIAVP